MDKIMHLEDYSEEELDTILKKADKKELILLAKFGIKMFKETCELHRQYAKILKDLKRTNTMMRWLFNIKKPFNFLFDGG